MRLIIFTCLLLLSTAVQAERDWTTEEKVWGAATTTLLLMDYGTTRNIAHRPTEYREMNPLLGQHPSIAQVNLHFLVAIPAVLLTANYFPEYRREILMVVSAVELVAVSNNLRIGLRLDF